MLAIVAGLLLNFAPLMTAGLAAFYLSVIVRTHPMVGWAAIVAIVALVAEFPGMPTPVLDGVWLVLALASLPKLSVAWATAGRPVAFAFPLAGVMALSVSTGVLQLGVAPAIQEFRATWMILVVTVWVLTQVEDINFEQRVRQAFTLLASVLIIVGLVHIARFGIGSADEGTLVNGEFQTSRALVSGQAIMLLAAGAYLAFRHRRRLLPVAALTMVLVAQHRSVWAAAGAMVLVALATRGTARRVVLSTLPFALVAAAAILLSGALDGLLATLYASLQSRGTLDARTEGWIYLVSRQNALGAYEVLVGQPSGSGFLRPNGQGLYISYAPHNWYVSTYLRTGLIGLACLLGLFASAAVKQFGRRSGWQLALLASLAVYAWAYHLPWYVGVLLGLCLAGHDSGSSAQVQTTKSQDAESAASETGVCGSKQATSADSVRSVRLPTRVGSA